MTQFAMIPAAAALEGEIWRDIPGYEGLYRVSNRGRVQSLPRLTSVGMQGGRMLKLILKGRPGYERLGVTLSKDNVKKAAHGPPARDARVRRPVPRRA